MNTISQCMDIVQFGMKSTLIQFRGKYYVYCRAASEEVMDKDVVLAIGAYESAFFANIVASYVFEKTEECFEMRQWSKKETQKWLQCYQSIVNKLAGGDYLQLTTNLWQPLAADEVNLLAWKYKKEEGVMVIYDAKFPFLNMEMFWDEKGEMRFQVYREEK
eukprot:9567517-Ditylum_brightwellii.AAC.1